MQVVRESVKCVLDKRLCKQLPSCGTWLVGCLLSGTCLWSRPLVRHSAAVEWHSSVDTPFGVVLSGRRFVGQHSSLVPPLGAALSQSQFPRLNPPTNGSNRRAGQEGFNCLMLPVEPFGWYGLYLNLTYNVGGRGRFSFEVFCLVFFLTPQNSIVKRNNHF